MVLAVPENQKVQKYPKYSALWSSRTPAFLKFQKRQLQFDISCSLAAAEQQTLKKRKMGWGVSTAAEPQTIVPVVVEGKPPIATQRRLFLRQSLC